MLRSPRDVARQREGGLGIDDEHGETSATMAVELVAAALLGLAVGVSLGLQMQSGSQRVARRIESYREAWLAFRGM